jgi:hypothetical protein
MRQVEGMSELRTQEMTVAEYLTWWSANSGEKPAREVSTHVVDRVGAAQQQGNTGAELLYLKDWNFEKENPDYGLYDWPEHFREDWLNDFERSTASDHRFVYLGAKDTYTPLHKDTLNSFSWSASISGRKRWWMLPPEVGPLLEDAAGTKVFDIRSVEHERFPNCEKALESLNLIDQLPGEVIFVPSGWWHQVVNLDDALSVNHNWINGANIMCTWNFLKDERAKVFTSGTGMILPRAKR